MVMKLMFASGVMGLMYIAGVKLFCGCSDGSNVDVCGDHMKIYTGKEQKADDPLGTRVSITRCISPKRICT